MTNIAILASGTGSNAAQIVAYLKDNTQCSVALIVSNKPDAKVLQMAQQEGIYSSIVPNDTWRDRPAQVIKIFEDHNIDFIVLAGFLRKVPEQIIKRYKNCIINIHPALLPKYGGKGMYGMHIHQAVHAAQEKETGITIHYVDNEYDRGPIIFQTKVKIDNNATPQSIAQKVLEVEHHFLPRIVAMLAPRISRR